MSQLVKIAIKVFGKAKTISRSWITLEILKMLILEERKRGRA